VNRYAIIGNGVAGVRAAEAILRHDPTGRVVSVTDEVHPFYLRTQLPAYVAGRVGEGALRGRTPLRLDESRFELRLATRALALDVTNHRVHLSTGETLDYDRLVIATGASPRRLGLPNEDASGVVRLKTLEDARRVRLAVQEAASAVIVGSGIFGLELLDGLVARGLKTTYCLTEERFWPEALDPTASRLAADDLAAAGVVLRFKTPLVEVRVRDGRLVGVVAAGGELVECQVLGVAVGYAPTIDFLADSGIETDVGVLVDDHLRTSAPDVFAAGDVVQLRRPLPGTSGVSVRWHNAWQQGHVAGGNAAGLTVAYPAAATTTSARLIERDFAVLGEGHLPAGGDLTEMIGDGPKSGVYKRLVFRSGRLTGALLYGNVRETMELVGHVQAQTPENRLPKGLLRRLFDPEAPARSGASVVCPACKLEIPLAPDAKEGDVITCTACGIEMRLQRRGNRLVGLPV
jgi:nitrite reductase (NADH) large subunit